MARSAGEPAFPQADAMTTTRRGDFVIGWDDRLGVWVLGDTRTNKVALYGENEYDAAVAAAERAKRENRALVSHFTFDTFKGCAECGRPIDRRSTICRSCARLHGSFDSDRARAAVAAREARRNKPAPSRQ